jgi:Eco57I restriction-modification methylase
LKTTHSTHSKRTALKIEQAARRFENQYTREHATLTKFIQGIPSESDRARYASLMLNRLMFVYFIQKKGFLNKDINYLPNCLRAMQERKHKDTCLSFYRHFLLPLFHEGLSKQDHSPELDALLGKVSYLNGGLFDVHELEHDNPDIQIPDEAFQRIFVIFDAYQWHLDACLPCAGNELNPDALGYIFEKYINQKQTGAYYTKEDIAEYISKNTIIPFLLNAVEQKCPTVFQPGGSPWQQLQEDPDRYIYDALKKGIELSLPPEIEVGLHDVSKRTAWNKPAPAAYALPTEIWREVVARRKRYARIRAKLAAGAVHSVNDLTTYNLDIRQFAQDVIDNCKEPELLRAFYTSISNLTVLDPTCGSGAFLLAALNILEPLYTACIQRMSAIVGNHIDLHEHTLYNAARPGAQILKEFRCILDKVEQHTNPRFFILKSIIVNNIYGVDISREVVEICKLRLFLKLLSSVESKKDLELLPGVDFNIRVGNALLGFVSYEEALKTISSRHKYQDRLVRWKRNQPPLHWFIEFHEIMRNGGFDVITGNPPYVEYEQVSRLYPLATYTTLSTGNLYALTMERCVSLLAPGGRFGMIVPSSATCTDGYLPLQKILLEQSALHISSYSDQRGKLFDIPHPRLCIIMYQKRPAPKGVFATPYLKLGRDLREYLFQRLEYIEVTHQVRPGIIPRYGACVEQSLHTKLHTQSQHLGDYLRKTGSHKLYCTRKLSWFVQVTPFIPKIIDEQGSLRKPSELKTLSFASPEQADIAFVALNSNLFYWFITAGSDCRNLNMREVLGLPLSIDEIAGPARRGLSELATRLAEDLQAHSEMRKMSFKDTGTLTIQCTYPARSKPIIDQVDHALAQHYGFTGEELDFIINYDIKYRLGRENGE